MLIRSDAFDQGILVLMKMLENAMFAAIKSPTVQINHQNCIIVV